MKNIEIRLAETAGFCMGVRRAVDMVLDMAQHKGKRQIFTYGPLIHNPQTVELLQKRGIVPVKDLEGIAEGATVVIRAHGISPLERETLKKKGVLIIDATCPKVGRVQSIIKKHAALEYDIVIVGDAEHPEVDGLLGYAGDRGFVVSSREDAERLPAMEKVCVVAQTTQSLDEYRAIVEKIRTRVAETVVFDTICDSTEKRQAEIKELACEMDAVFIVGGRNSANTQRLVQISESMGTPTFHIETAGEIRAVPLGKYDRIGISAGASTPNWIIEHVCDTIQNVRLGADTRGYLFNLWLVSVGTDIYSALGAACLALAAQYLQGVTFSILQLFMAASYVFSVHTLNRFVDRQVSGIRGSFREETYASHARLFICAAFLAMLLSLGLAYMIGLVPYLMLAAVSVVGALYNLRISPKGWRFRRLRDLPGTKNFLMAAAWALVIAVIPYVEWPLDISSDMVVAFLFVFSIVFVRSALSDLIEIQSDRLLGRETIPVVIGEEKTRKLLDGISLFLALLLVTSYPLGWTTSLSFTLFPCVFYMWICFELCDRKTALSAAVINGLLETNYVLAGLCTVVWLVALRLLT
ncbi:MAG TPA: 4-hydroxy-3-methylbut-2-enyl diphosphate reductase [Syntrophales bacterium]|nr:4-hydroxy-3-methylbut-2-enyl diphosphate reductase [Syntrophales bacterium]